MFLPPFRHKASQYIEFYATYFFIEKQPGGKMDFKTIRYEKNGPVGILRMNRPEKRNAINAQMLDELYLFFNERLRDHDTRVLVLEGAGSIFSAGADLKEPAIDISEGLDPVAIYTGQRRFSEIILLMTRLPQPIIASIHGPAVGAGFSMTLACDIRIATEKAFFSAAYINIGLGGADMGSSYLLPRIIGVTRANRYLLTGDKISALEAERIGLVNEIVSEEKLSETVFSIADTMCSKNPFGLRMTKEAINQNLNAGSLEEAILLEDRNQALISFSLDTDKFPGLS